MLDEQVGEEFALMCRGMLEGEIEVPEESTRLDVLHGQLRAVRQSASAEVYAAILGVTAAIAVGLARARQRTQRGVKDKLEEISRCAACQVGECACPTRPR